MEQKEQKLYVGQIFDPRINADTQYWVSVPAEDHLCKQRCVEAIEAVFSVYRLPKPLEVTFRQVEGGKREVIMLRFSELLTPYQYALVREIVEAVYKMTASLEWVESDYHPFAGP